MKTERDYILAKMSPAELDLFAAKGGRVPRERLAELEEYRASIEQVAAAKRLALKLERDQRLAAIRDEGKRNAIDWSIEAAEARKAIKYKGRRISVAETHRIAVPRAWIQRRLRRAS